MLEFQKVCITGERSSILDGKFRKVCVYCCTEILQDRIKIKMGMIKYVSIWLRLVFDMFICDHVNIWMSVFAFLFKALTGFQLIFFLY